MSEMGAGSVARYCDAVFIKGFDGSWYKATYSPGNMGHSDETMASFGEILYKVSPLEGLEAGAIISGPHPTDVAILDTDGLWQSPEVRNASSTQIYTAFDEDVTIVRRKA